MKKTLSAFMLMFGLFLLPAFASSDSTSAKTQKAEIKKAAKQAKEAVKEAKKDLNAAEDCISGLEKGKVKDRSSAIAQAQELISSARIRLSGRSDAAACKVIEEAQELSSRLGAVQTAQLQQPKRSVSQRLGEIENALTSGAISEANRLLSEPFPARMRSAEQARYRGLDIAVAVALGQEEKIAALQKELDGIRQAGGPAAAAVNEANARVDKSHDELSNIKTQLSGIEQRQQALTKERDTLKQDVAKLTKEVDKQTDALAAADKEKETLQQKLTATEPVRVERDTLQTKVAELTNQLNTKAGELAAAQKTIISLSASMGETQKLVKKTMTIDELVGEINVSIARIMAFGTSPPSATQ